MLTEAEQQPLPNLYQNWLTPTERAERRNQELDAEVTRRIIHINDGRGPSQTPEVIENDVDPGIVDTSNSETEEGNKNGDRVEHFRKNTPRRSGRLQISRRSEKITGREPQYMGLFCSLEGKDDVLTIDAV